MTTNRRSFVKTALGAAAMAPAVAAAQAQGPRDWSEQNPVRYPDADIVVLDKRFAKYKLGGTSIHRLYTGMLWAEGPACNGVGRYLVHGSGVWVAGKLRGEQRRFAVEGSGVPD